MIDPLRDFPLVRDGYRKGIREGKALGEARGEARGKVQGKAESLLNLLQSTGARGQPSPARQNPSLHEWCDP